MFRHDALFVLALSTTFNVVQVHDDDSSHQESTANCASIKDHDKRHYCMAITTGKESWCASIKSSDLRHTCYAILKK